MEYKDVKFLDLPTDLREEALEQMAEINKEDKFYEAETAEDFSKEIMNDNYNPDKDFYFMLYEDGTLQVYSQKAK